MPKSHHTWALGERHFLRVARSEYDLTFPDLTRLFAHTFSDGFWPDGLPTDQRLVDEYNGRHLSGRSTMWRNHVVRDNYTAAQEQDRQQARDDIEAAANALGIAVIRHAPETSALAQNAHARTVSGGLPVPDVSDNGRAANRQPAHTNSTLLPPTSTLKRKRDTSISYTQSSVFEGRIGGPKRAKTGAESSSTAQTAPDGKNAQADTMNNQEQLPSHYGGRPRSAIGPRLLNALDNNERLRAAASGNGAPPQVDPPRLPRLNLNYTDTHKRGVVDLTINSREQQSQAAALSAPHRPDIFNEMAPVPGVPMEWQARLARTVARLIMPEQREQAIRVLDREIARRREMEGEKDGSASREDGQK